MIIVTKKSLRWPIQRALLGLAFGFVSLAVNAQVAMSTTGSYAQNFDSPTLANTGTPTWTENSTIANWYWQTALGASTIYNTGTGSANTGGRWSYGSAALNDRAMGSLGGGTLSHVAQGVLLRNTSAQSITNITVTYTGEQWRNGGNLATQNLSFFFQVSASPITALTPGTNGTWTAVSGLNFTSLVNTATAAAVDGNSVGNRTTFSNVAIPALVVPAGSYIMLKWDDLNDSGNDHGMAIDDLTINWTVSAPVLTPSTITFGTTTPTSVVVNLAGGTGTGRIVVAKQGSAATFSPTNGTAYTGANSDFTVGTDLGAGNIHVFNAAGNAVTVTGLAPSTTYHFATYDYDGATTYSASSGTNSTTTPGPIPYNGGTYTQDFNGLPSAGTFNTVGLGVGPVYAGVSPVNATGMLGWQYAKVAGSSPDVSFTVNDGTSPSGGNVSFGTVSNSDRAFGTQASGSMTAGIGAVIRNTTAQPLTSFTISYTGEQWRNGGSNTPNALAFSYALDGTGITSGTYTSVSTLDFISPQSSVTASPLDGNQPANRTAVSFTVNMGANWLPGTDLVIRWTDNNDSGNDDGLAIEDLSFSATAPVAPTVQDNSIAFTNILTTSTTVDWLNGDGANRIVVVRQGSAPTYTPANGSVPSGVNSDLTLATDQGGGDKVVYIGTGNTVNVTGLTAGTQYHVRVFAYNGVTASAIYNTSTAVQNPSFWSTLAPSTATKLAVVSLNAGNPVREDTPFSILVGSQDNSNAPQVVNQNTTVTVSLGAGAGAVGGTLTGIMLAGTSQVLISGITYDVADLNVVLNASTTAGQTLASVQSAPFTVLGLATNLSVVNTPLTGLVNTPIAAFQVVAFRDDATVDAFFTGAVVITVLSGPGAIGGTTTVNASGGVANFSNITFNAGGTYQLQASSAGLLDGTSALIVITAPPTMTELVVSRYIGSRSTASGNASRTPFASCLRFDNLVPNTAYDLRLNLATTAEAATVYGAGNVWTGTAWAASNLNAAFTTNGAGSSGPVWVYIQPTANNTSGRFGAGTAHNLRVGIAINGNPMPNTPTFVGAKTITSLDIAPTALSGSTLDDGAYVRGISQSCLSGKFILAFDNVAGTGDPLYAYQAIATTPTDANTGNYSSHPAAIGNIYLQAVGTAAGDHVLIVPIGANNPNGVQRIEARNLDNTTYNTITDADGNWPGGANTTTLARRAVAVIGGALDPNLGTAPPVTTGSYGPVCYNGAALPLSGSPAGGVWSGTGVSGGSFDPTVAGPGTWTVTYAFTDANTCTSTGNTAITVTAPPGGSCTNNYTCATAYPLLCGDTKLGATIGGSNTLPTSACAFNNYTTTGAVNWWVYTNGATPQDIKFAACTSSFDLLLSAFRGGTCGSLTCAGGTDNGPNATCGFGAELKVYAAANEVIYLAVHGTATGTYTLAVECAAPLCALTAANDLCSGATSMDLVATPFAPVIVTDDLSCAYVDGPTLNSGTNPALGLWYSFNSGPNSLIRMAIGGGTALGLQYALFNGASCVGAEVPATIGLQPPVLASGFRHLVVTPFTPYRLLVFNSGADGLGSTYNLTLEAPPLLDASITQIVSPVAGPPLCGNQITPTVTLKNLGETTLTSVNIKVTITSVNPTLTYNIPWTGSLAYLAEATVNLGLLNTPSGNYTLTVETTLLGDERPLNDAQTVNLSSTGQPVTVSIRGANIGVTSWTIFNAANVTVATGICTQTNQDFPECLPNIGGNNGRYSFLLVDNGSAGLQPGGSWELRDAFGAVLLQDDRALVGTNSPASPQATTGYGNSHEFHLPLGPSRPWTTSPYQICGNFNLGVQSKIRCTTAAGAGYQWEISDPNRGYRRRVSATLNYIYWTNFGTAAPVLGTRYFVRNRVDQGAAGFGDDNWGAGCEMGWAANSTAFCTNLITTPGSTLSCNVTHTWGGASKIWAQPVVGALPYDANGDGDVLDAGDISVAYHFRITAPGYVKDAWTTSYILPLTWATLPMLAGTTYTVQVEAQVGGVWRGFCSATTCTVTIAPAGPAQGGRIDEPAASIEALQLWPNPVRDGRVTLRIEGISDTDQRITVDVYDAFGKRVIAQQFANSGDLFNTTLELGNEISGGLYMVNVNINGRTYVKHLSVL